MTIENPDRMAGVVDPAGCDPWQRCHPWPIFGSKMIREQ